MVLLKNWGSWHNFWLSFKLVGKLEFTGACGDCGADGGDEFGGSRGGGGSCVDGGGAVHLT